MIFSEDIFHSYDIRGLLEEITPELANLVGSAIVKRSNAKTVVVGRDMRANSEELAKAAMQGVILTGANVIDIGMCSTSLFNFAVSSIENVDAGIMITASHNPAEYNGIKMATGDAIPISGHEIRKLLDEEFTPADTKGSVEKIEITNKYLDFCLSNADLPDLKGTKVVVDYGNGMGALTMTPLLERLGIEFIEMYKEPDARFPNHEANPAKESTLEDLKKRIVEEGADFGFAIDGDADRIGFVDDAGESVRGDLMLALLATEVLKENQGGKVISSPNQSWRVREMVEDAGGEIFEEKIGRTNIIHAMHKNNAVLGGEVSSHFFFKEFSNLEAVDYAFLLVLSLWKKSEKTFSDFVAPLRKYVNSGEINTMVGNKNALVQKIEEFYAPQATTVNKLDGIRCEFGKDWWFILRPSNTEPLLRLTVEAKNKELMKEKVEEIRELMKGV